MLVRRVPLTSGLPVLWLSAAGAGAGLNESNESNESSYAVRNKWDTAKHASATETAGSQMDRVPGAQE